MMTYAQSNKSSVEKAVREIRRTARRNYSVQETIRLVLEGLRNENLSLKDALAELMVKTIFLKKHDRG